MKRVLVGSLLALLLIGPSIAFAGLRETTTHRSMRFYVVRERGVRKVATSRVSATAALEWQRVSADFPALPPAAVTIRIFATHTTFARALKSEQGEWPEAPTDDMGNIVRDRLPLGPSLPLLRHRLAHVLTEWILDRLTHNRRDVEPYPAWLYDGLAEWEAARRAPPVACQIGGALPIPLRSLASPAGWWKVRGGPLGSLEYCEAQIAFGHLVARQGGWRQVRLELARHPLWRAFVTWIGA